MLQFYTTLCLFAIAITCFLSALSAPTPPLDVTTRILNGITHNETDYENPLPPTSIIHPHFITIERLESLLRRAGEIFRPLIQSQAAEQQENSNLAPIPLEQLQPPTVHPYNFYLPPFEHEIEQDIKLDEKSKSMERFTPPPLSDNEKDETNYYASKPKKLPKKFNASEKLVNIKWLNAFEREALADGDGQIPKAVYLVNDERNRINFDDSFFAVDMHVRTPADNNPHKESKQNIGINDGDQDFLNQSEDGEDLVAAPAAHVSQLSYGYRTKEKLN